MNLLWKIKTTILIGCMTTSFQMCHTPGTGVYGRKPLEDTPEKSNIHILTKAGRGRKKDLAYWLSYLLELSYKTEFLKVPSAKHPRGYNGIHTV